MEVHSFHPYSAVAVAMLVQEFLLQMIPCELQVITAIMGYLSIAAALFYDLHLPDSITEFVMVVIPNHFIVVIIVVISFLLTIVYVIDLQISCQRYL